MIPQSFIQDLLNRLDIVEVVQRSLPLRKAGANYSACCPFHSEKTPSFTVSPTKQFYHCFGCGAHGSAVGFVMQYQGLSFVEAVTELAHSVGMQVPVTSSTKSKPREDTPALELIMRQAMDFYRNELKRSEKAIAYLKERGLSGEIAARFGLGYAPGEWQGLAAAFEDYSSPLLAKCGLVVEGSEGKRYDRFRDRIMFPIFNARKQVVGFGGRILTAVEPKRTGPTELPAEQEQGTQGNQPSPAKAVRAEPKYLNSPETPLFEKGRELYGLSQARQAIRTVAKVLVVEGYMDVVALAQHGVDYAVATLGTAVTASQIRKLTRESDVIVFCFDGDEAGRQAAWRAMEESLPLTADNRRFEFLLLPEGEDPDSYIRAQGKARFEALISEAQPLSQFLVNGLTVRADLRSPEGRAHVIQSAKPLLKKIAAPALRQLLKKQLAEHVRVTVAELAKLTDAGTAPQPAARTKPHRASPSLYTGLLKMVLFQPGFASRIEPAWIDASHGGAQTLTEVVEFLKARPHVQSTAFIIEHFRSTEHEALLDHAFQEASIHYLDEADPAVLAAEFEDALARLHMQNLSRRESALLERSRNASLSLEESQELLNLQKTKRGLQERKKSYN